MPVVLRRALPLLLAGLLLAGCAPAPVVDGDHEARWQARQLAIGAIPAWQVSGRMAIQAAGEGYHGRFDWKQHGDQLDLTVSGPFSQGSARLRGDRNGVELQDGQGGSEWAADADALLRQATGLQVPVSGLRYWMLGLPVPAEAEQSRTVDDQGRLLKLSQSGWEIDYRDYMEVDGQSLPRKVFLQRDDLRVRLVVGQWQL